MSKSKKDEKRSNETPAVNPATIATAGVVEKMLTANRACPNIPYPNWEALPRNKVFDSRGMPITENLRAHFLREGLLSETDALEIINRAGAIMRREPNLMRLNDPITVCGDIHGQYYDLIKLLEIGGDPRDQQYLFLGDYVDRGCFGCEVALYLFAFKIKYPDSFFMLRGNHECRHLTAYFNSKAETKYKYSLAVYDAMMGAFDCLPLACILNGRFLCVHGGLSPEIKTVDDINLIQRFREPPSSGPMCDLLWSDPMEDEQEGAAGVDALFLHNELRGCSYVFSYAATCQFLVANHLLSVIRAHEAQDEGYRLYKKSSTGFPSVICIFSAPNYCDTYENKAAIIRFQNNLMNIRQFNSSNHPYYLPNFMNAFTWSLPFVAEKVTDMLTTIMQMCEDLDDESPEGQAGQDKGDERQQQIRRKILAMGKMAKMFRTLREENESIVELKGLAGGQLPLGVIQQGPKAIRAAINGFEQAKLMDLGNEKRPQFSPDS